MVKADKKTFIIITSIAAAFVVAFMAFIIILAVILGKDEEKPQDPETQTFTAIEDVKGVWIASVSNIDFPSKPDLSKEELQGELDAIVKNVKNAGLDTIFFQVRPSSDALYDSEIFPVSRYMSSDGTLTIDALDYIISVAKKEGISVHAWVNPLRVAVGGTVEDLPKGHPARENPQWCVKYADGKIYYNCAIPEVRQLIADGIKEIVENYDVDGVAFDDYFYPYPYYETDSEGNKVIAAFEDSDSFAQYGTEYDDIGDWRRENVNKLVKVSYDTVKEADASLYFGVSPFGIWKNGYGDESGSATRGSQSYFDIYCDTIAWVEGGYVDYVAPQIYWRAENSAASYTALCDWWALMLSDKDTALLVSHAAYRYDEWETPEGIMTSQVQYAEGFDCYKGSIFYGYEEIVNNTCGITDEIKSIYIKEENE